MTASHCPWVTGYFPIAKALTFTQCCGFSQCSTPVIAIGRPHQKLPLELQLSPQATEPWLMSQPQVNFPDLLRNLLNLSGTRTW